MRCSIPRYHGVICGQHIFSWRYLGTQVFCRPFYLLDKIGVSQSPPKTYKRYIPLWRHTFRSKTQSKPVLVRSTNCIAQNQTRGIMATARDIAQRPGGAVSHSLSISPTAAFHSPLSSHSFRAGGGFQEGLARQLKPFNTGDIKILLLENVNQSGIDILKAQGYQVEAQKASLPEAQLIEKIRCVTPSPLRLSEEAEFPPAIIPPTFLASLSQQEAKALHLYPPSLKPSQPTVRGSSESLYTSLGC